MKRRFLCAMPQVAGVATALVALAGAPALAFEPPARSGAGTLARPPQTRARAPLNIVLTKIPKKIVNPKKAISISGYVQNQSGQPLSGLSVRLRFRDTPLNSRLELAQYGGATPPALPRLSPETVQLNGPLQAGAQAGWRLKARPDALGMGRFGVYAVAIEVFNPANGLAVATRTTFMVVMEAKYRPHPTQVAWVWPVMDRPHRAGDGTFLDDRLVTDLAPTGRLGGIVQAAEKSSLPVTWAIDPALLDDVRTMTRDYAIGTIKGGKVVKAVKKPRSDAARQWLEELRTATSSAPFFTVPYADPDPVALVDNGMRRHLAVAYQNASVAGEKDLLGRQPTLSVAWPPAGAVDQATLDQLALKSESFLLNDRVLPNRNQNFTRNATTTVDAAKSARKAVGYDSTINEVISADTRTPGDVQLAEQRFLAETAMISAEQPGNSRTLVIAPNRRWNPDPAFAEHLLRYTQGAGWLKAVPLEKIIDARPDRVDPRTLASYPTTFAQRDLPGVYLKKVRAVSSKATHFASIFQPPTNAYERSVLRTESSYWRDHPFSAVKVRDIVENELDRDISKIHVVDHPGSGGNYRTLVGNSGKIPLTISNDLSAGTVTVRLNVVSQNPARLRVGTPDPGRLTLHPGEKQTVYVPVQAYANGDTDVLLELDTPSGKRLGTIAQINVRTTGYGKTALLVTGGGLAVLVLSVGVRAVRARRRNGKGTEEPSDGPPAGEPSPAGDGASSAAAMGGRGNGAYGGVVSPGSESPVPSPSGTDTGSTPA